MNILDFQKRLSRFPLFSLQDIRKAVPGFSSRQLDRWAKKDYLRKIRQGYYTLSQQQIDQQFLFYAANKIYNPSYLSLETALKYYGLIPEEIFQLTSVTTKKTAKFATPVGNFSYRHLKPALFFGYRLVELGKRRVLIAEPEKAVLDYLYLTPSMQTADDFRSMRINSDQFCEQVEPQRFRKLASAFGFKALQRRAETFLNTV
ncbi:MAG: hypothetical protein FVQ81_13940 [Candidatus Glassbacteria bacterium]|nr:hypothetical protein [Candidatus Glassbacteria bacterium]